MEYYASHQAQEYDNEVDGFETFFEIFYNSTELRTVQQTEHISTTKFMKAWTLILGHLSNKWNLLLVADI